MRFNDAALHSFVLESNTMPLAPRLQHDDLWSASPTSLDRLLHGLVGRLTSGISPAALGLAGIDWLLHLSTSPGKQWQLIGQALRQQSRLASHALALAQGHAPLRCIEPLPQDHRFDDPAWQRWPFNWLSQGFLLQQQWWHHATTGIGGMSAHHEQVVAFVARQCLDVVSPANHLLANPVVLDATLRESGANLLRGRQLLLEDRQRLLTGQPSPEAEHFRPGHEVAATPGEVVYRNDLIELIRYTPVTGTVFAEPLLIVPAWIMKYYILDLSEHNSLVRFLIERGHVVFMISWRNPVADDRDLGMEDYLQLGVIDALQAVRAIVPDVAINTAGYCLGGTLLATAAAWLARHDPTLLHSVTLLAAQTDFTEAGELQLFIDDSQLDFLDDLMWLQGMLDNRQMAGAFRLLRSNDLIWSALVDNYLMGQRAATNDLMAWNADTTRMPYRMHSEYLRSFFLANDLFAGRYRVQGSVVSLSDIRVPVCAVATEKDHVAPWRSVFKIQLLADTDICFILASGGHNGGIVSEPGHPGRHYRIAQRHPDMHYVSPGEWLSATAQNEGSWWPAWSDWLAQQSCGRVAAPAGGGISLGPAPGQYVLQR
jgi:polyhydroxyalkanoate synthase